MKTTPMNSGKPASLGGGVDSIFRVSEVVGDAWSWLVMREAVLHDVSRFAEFQTRLGIARSTLSARLTQLTAGGLLAQHHQPRGPEYHLTAAGEDFFGCLMVAMRWGDQWHFQPDTRPLKTKHLGCGDAFEGVLRCAACHEVLQAREVTARPPEPVVEQSRTPDVRRRTPALELLERKRASSIARTLTVVGDWWSTLVIRECFFGTRRFDDFQQRLDIAPNILSGRLRRLVELGILEQVQLGSWPLRHEYRLTTKGFDLYHVPLAMHAWGRRWLEPARSDTYLIHKRCDREVHAETTCGSCGATASRADVALLPDRS